MTFYQLLWGTFEAKDFCYSHEFSLLDIILDFPFVNDWFELAICIQAIANTNFKELNIIDNMNKE